MINFTTLLREAEAELAASETLMRATKMGILFGVLAAALRKYATTAVSNEDVVKLMAVLTRDGRLFETLPLSEFAAGAHAPAVDDAPLRHDDAVGDDARHTAASLSPDEQQARDDDIKIMRAKGFREEEIAAILALGGLASGGEVESRTDEELARYEADRREPFPGMPRGTPINSFTMTEPDPLPEDLLKAVTS